MMNPMVSNFPTRPIMMAPGGVSPGAIPVMPNYGPAYGRAPGMDGFVPSFSPATSMVAAPAPVPVTNGETPLRIVYNNDPHKQLWAMPEVIAGFQEKIREGLAKGVDVLSLNGGDNNIGKSYPEWCLQLGLNQMQMLTAAALGNHEWDLGTAEFARGIKETGYKTPILVSNINITPNSSIDRLVKEHHIFNKPIIVNAPHGRYGLLGVTTPDLSSVIDPTTPLEGMSTMDMGQTKKVVQQQVEWLKSQGINKVIVVSHMGLHLDQELAQSVDGIDVVVGGHSHDTLRGILPGKNWLRGPKGDPVIILQAGKNGKYFGVLDLFFDQAGRVKPYKNQIFKADDFPKFPAAETLLHQVLGPPKTVGVITSYYNNENNAFEPDPVAAFTADHMRKMANAEIAIVRSNELRKDIRPGALTDQEVKLLMPFNDEVVRFWMTGEEIMRSLEQSAKGLKERDTHPGMIHPSGMMFTMDENTGKVDHVMVYDRKTRHWEPIDPKRRYTVAIGEYAIKNGNEWPDCAHPERVHWRSGMPIRNVFLWALQKTNAIANPIEFLDDGRVTIHH